MVRAETGVVGLIPRLCRGPAGKVDPRHAWMRFTSMPPARPLLVQHIAQPGQAGQQGGGEQGVDRQRMNSQAPMMPPARSR